MNEASMNLADAEPSSHRRRPRIASWVCALSSCALLVVFVAFAAHLRLGLGHLPTPMFERYDTHAFRAHELLLVACFHFATFVAAPLWMICQFVPSLRPSWPWPAVPQLATFALGWLLIIAILAFDPTTFSAWVLD